MYSVDERDKVIELEEVPQSSVGAPLPLVLSDEHKILLAYIVQETSADQRRSRLAYALANVGASILGY